MSKKTLIIILSIIGVLVAGIITLTVISVKDAMKKTVPNKYGTGEWGTETAEEVKDMDITKNPVATIEMQDGKKIVFELYPEIAPNTVCNFIDLANSGFYDGLIFHRCIEGFMIQGGDPKGDGTGGPGYFIRGEFTNNGFQNDLKHERGVVSMARTAFLADSAGSQFFIMVETNAELDGNYASFGKVTEGMDVADAISKTETDSVDKPLTDQVMKKVRVDTKGETYPKPEKMGK